MDPAPVRAHECMCAVTVSQVLLAMCQGQAYSWPIQPAKAGC